MVFGDGHLQEKRGGSVVFGHRHRDIHAGRSCCGDVVF
jgi:hypothetical protein